MHLYIKLITIIIIGFSLSLVSCKKDDPSNDDSKLGSEPSHEHSTNDGIKNNNDGTYTITLGGVNFTTKSRNFSSDAVVTAPKTVSATQEAIYPMGKSLIGFGISDNYIVGAVDAKLIIYDMPNMKISDEYKTSFSVTGIDVNGAIMTTEGSENVNFYSLNSGKIDKHFFTIKSVNGSKFISVCHLDYNTAYVYDADEVVYFPLDNATNSSKPKLVDIPSFAKVTYSKDEKNIYFGLGDLSKPDPNDPNAAYINYSTIRIYDRASKQFNDHDSADDEQYTGITVDANYIYLSLADKNMVRVINKHNFNSAGSFSVVGAADLNIIGDNLYVYSKSDNKIYKFKINFN